jgi:hypothetical protein
VTIAVKFNINEGSATRYAEEDALWDLKVFVFAQNVDTGSHISEVSRAGRKSVQIAAQGWSGKEAPATLQGKGEKSIAVVKKSDHACHQM